MRCKFCGQEMEKTMIGEHYNFRDCANYLQAELARRDEIIARLKEDGERLASNVTTVIDEDGNLWCNACKNYDIHTEYCPITLHDALMKELAEC